MSNHNHNNPRHQQPPKANPPQQPTPVAAAAPQPQPAPVQVEAEGADSVVDEAPPAATVSVEDFVAEKRAAALAMRATTVAGKRETVVITPRENVNRMRYGKTYYTFVKNKPCSVPAEVARHLRERDLC